MIELFKHVSQYNSASMTITRRPGSHDTRRILSLSRL